ncbi:hypothetical protein K474DRAFT_1770318 [Panus rudis PR-1116 ss-1]|nr:hypothetical protein K474DRAFT_1770318 [Panus rudis PR-1116 ss-1]
MTQDSEQKREEQPTPAQESNEPSTSQPGTPPDPTSAEGATEARLSRKREREVSLEPATPQATSTDIDGTSESRDKDRKLYKKNRVSGQLDVTQEEDDIVLPDDESKPGSGAGSQTHTPSSSLPRGIRTPPKQQGGAGNVDMAAISCSPPIETKVRMISRGVEDLTWRNIQGANEGKDALSAVANGSGEEQQHEHAEEMEHEPTPAPEPKGQNDEITIPVPLGPNPPIADDEIAGEDEHAGVADPGEVPANAQPELRESTPVTASTQASQLEKTDIKSEPTPPPQASGSQPASRRSSPPPAPSHVSTRKPSPPLSGKRSLPPSRRQSQSEEPDSDARAGMKRKLGDRTVSDRHVPEQEDVDRKSKRRTPTPPVEEEHKEKEKGNKAQEEAVEQQNDEEQPSSGFMAYASPSSPFASVKGPKVFGGASTFPSSSTKPSPWATPSPSPQLGSSVFGSPFSSSATATHPPPTPSVGASSPPVPPTSSSPPQKRTGFEAFASVSSPFASAAKRPKSPPPPSSGHSGLGISSGAGGTPGASSLPFHAHVHNHGFGMKPKSAFRSPSPVRSGAGSGSGNATPSSVTSNAFAAYAGKSAFSAFASSSASSPSPFASSSSAFKTSTAKAGENASKDKDNDGSRSSSEEGDDGEKKVSFGERLRAEKDLGEDDTEEGANSLEGKKVELQEQEVLTGEEDEHTIYQVRGKLFALSSQNQWKEKGTGTIKLNVKREDGTGARLVMRKEAVYTVLLNATLFKGMRCFIAQDPRYLRFSVFEGGVTTHYNLRVANAKIAEDLLEEINSHIPTE